MMLFLVGFMGCGKSTVGRRLAERLGWSFCDLDAEIELRAGATVSEIFARNGEEGFRRMESETLREIMGADAKEAVVAVGGGAPCSEENLAAMRAAGRVVYMKMTPAVLVKRLERNPAKRPLLADAEKGALEDYVADLLDRREPFYSRAHMTLDCSGATGDYIINHILSFLEYFSAPHEPARGSEP